MKLLAVTTPKLEQAFLQVHVDQNKNSPHWIRPLDQDIQRVFDKKYNKALRFSELVRWVLFNIQGKPIGRLAAFVNQRYKNKGDQFRVGGIGFFDCINDQAAATLLFDAARVWLAERQVSAMDGPINLGERDRWWGLLVEGFQTPVYGMNYNPPYYQTLFENYGFQTFYRQICWSLTVANDAAQLPSKFYTAHSRFSNNPDYKVVNIRQQEREKFINYFCEVYNKAWASHSGNKQLSETQVSILFKAIRPVYDDYLVWFACYRDNPVAMWINVPDINSIIKDFKGKLNWWTKVKFLTRRIRGTCPRFVGVCYGVVPEFQGTGVDYYMIVEAEKMIKAKTRYCETELQWQGDFNPKMLNISKNLGAKQSRVLHTYRYLFDQKTPFKRHPIL